MFSRITLHTILLSGLVLGSFLPNGSSQEALRGAYLGMNPPGLVPEIFAPGLISTEAREIYLGWSQFGHNCDSLCIDLTFLTMIAFTEDLFWEKFS